MKIFYLHIPKTGGQTLARRMATAFAPGRSDIVGDQLSGDDVSGRKRLFDLFRKFDFVEKHTSGPVLGKMAGVRLLTTVREPVSQIVSNYLHITREPRNVLHRPATLLDPFDFFVKFGGFLKNNQSFRFVSAFERFPNFRSLDLWVAEKMLGCAGRVDWLVPTEEIDLFTMLWSLETGKEIPVPDVRVNESGASGSKVSMLRDIVRSMPHLYSIDLFLWDIAKNRFSDYRRGVVGSAVGDRKKSNVMCVYAKDSVRINLGLGWYAPQFGTSVGTAWWAGPESWSEVCYVRTAGLSRVAFTVAVVCGEPVESISISRNEQGDSIPFSVLKTEGGWRFEVDVSDLPLKGRFWLSVPQVWSPVMVDAGTMDCDRKSFAVCDWSFDV